MTRTLDRIGFALAHPVRATIVGELLSGRFLPSGELAKIARSAPSTTSEHLAILTDAGLVRAFTSGRHRYYTLASDDVARSLEALGALEQAAPPRTLSAHDRLARIRAARVCWDHIAGELGTRLRSALIDGAFVRAQGDDAVVTARGSALLADLGAGEVAAGSVAGACVDLTERRLHVRGPFAVALFRALCERGWLVRGPGRELRVTPLGAREFAQRLGIAGLPG
ncbi:MAG: helix-turn-helix domain-containing protein [Candidatus Velthaea sp.]|jgi:DNA-binding transcriptional ArsR family regulator